MYHFSRSIYRDLSPLIVGDPGDLDGARNRQAVLESCEATIRRLTTDRRYFARPERALFSEVRMHFALGDQRLVRQVIERRIALAVQALDQMPDNLDIDGQPRQCRAHTRRGTPCRREPLPSRDYCPSHKHLEESVGEPAGADQELLAA